ncbi:hypothetical protein [Streptomyces sp. NPDC046939]|uniref:hypothetical protein n=1 Tax=Streptomyces sp. NPDC046939 TaxID=3155376 RepID=UPI0033C99FE4
MSEHTPSQAEGDTGDDARDPDGPATQQEEHRDVPRTTPSQAEGDADDGEGADGPEQ